MMPGPGRDAARRWPVLAVVAAACLAAGALGMHHVPEFQNVPLGADPLTAGDDFDWSIVDRSSPGSGPTVVRDSPGAGGDVDGLGDEADDGTESADEQESAGSLDTPTDQDSFGGVEDGGDDSDNGGAAGSDEVEEDDVPYQRPRSLSGAAVGASPFDVAVMWACNVRPEMLVEWSHTAIAGVFRDCLAKPELRARLTPAAEEGAMHQGASSFELRTILETTEHLRAAADAAPAGAPEEESPRPRGAGREMPASCQVFVTNVLCGKAEEPQYLPGMGVQRWVAAEAMYRLADGASDQAGPAFAAALNEWIRADTLDPEPSTYTQFGLNANDAVKLLTTAKTCAPLDWSALTPEARAAVAAVLLPPLHRSAGAAVDEVLENWVYGAARYAGRRLLQDRARAEAELATFTRQSLHEFRQFLKQTLKSEGYIQRARDFPDHYEVIPIKQIENKYFAIAVAAVADQRAGLEPLEDGLKVASKYWRGRTPDVTFGVSLVQYLDEMTHGLWSKADYRARLEEGWAKYRTAMAEQIGKDAERLDHRSTQMAITTTQFCARDGMGAELGGAAMSLQLGDTERECSRLTFSPAEVAGGSESCQTTCNIEVKGHGHDAARDYDEHLFWGLGLARREYSEAESAKLRTRAGAAFEQFDPAGYMEACGPRPHETECDRRLEAMLLAWHASQFVGNAVSPAIRDKLGSANVGLSGVVDRAAVRLAAGAASVSRTYQWVVKNYDEATGRTGVVNVRAEAVVAAPEYVVRVELFIDALDDMASFQVLASDEAMNKPTYVWSRDNPQAAVYGTGGGRVWRYKNYSAGTLYGKGLLGGALAWLGKQVGLGDDGPLYLPEGTAGYLGRDIHSSYSYRSGPKFE